MEDETRTYTGYLARLVGLVVALILFGLAIWFFTQLGNDETGVVVAPDDNGTPYSVTDNILGGNQVAVSENTGSDITAATEEEIASANTSSTSNGELPDTGPAETTLVSLAVGLFIISGYKFLTSRRQLKLPLSQ